MPIGGEQQLWAQRCKVYIYRSAASNWISLGTGKCQLLEEEHGDVVFRFEDTSLRIPTVKHSLATATSLQRNSTSGRGFSWSAKDEIQGREEVGDQWFTIKFASAEAASSFKGIFDSHVGSHEDAHGAVTETGADSRRSNASVRMHQVASTDSQRPGYTRAGSISPATSMPASPMVSVRAFKAAAAAASADSGGEAWLLYFEQGTHMEDGAVREARTVYIGVYGSKAAAIENAPRAMDLYGDPNLPWRLRNIWGRREDYRRRVGDKGTVLAVKNADGSYQQTKIRKLHHNRDLPECVPDSGDLWE
mmetsp:Transcript_71117/g.205941  ORF Transcript_71117/g.205941 Transcript_71117/m.205941 type:complete len:305 (+) Transcript_71117:68-982(+)